MSDYRQQLVNSIEESIINYLDRETTDIVTGTIIRILGDYEITKRCTDVVVYDDLNERIVKRYCACLMIDGKSKNTISAYKLTIRRFVEFMQKNITEIGTYDIRYFLACEKERGISNRSLENTRANLSAFFQWMTLEEIIPKNPCMNIKPVKYKDEVRKAFSDVEIDQIRSACRNTRERALIEFLLATGVRVSELAGMDLEDVDTEKRTVHVRNGKGAKERITYISDVALSHLRKYLLSRRESGEALFYGGKGHKRISTDGVQRLLHTIGERAGVPNVHPHRFRRTFATGLANRGMKVQEIQKLLGHSNINTTLQYVYTDDKSVEYSYRQNIA